MCFNEKIGFQHCWVFCMCDVLMQTNVYICNTCVSARMYD